MKALVIGAGMIGRERIKALEKLKVETFVVDPLYSKITLDDGLSMEPDWVFICTPHDVAVQIAPEVYSNCFKVLCEKPLGRTPEEYEDIINKFSPYYRVGFNYRFYKGVKQLLEDCRSNLFGDLVSVNMVLSLGDGPGSEKTWRLDPDRAGIGAILDPGIHLIDLALQISGGLTKDYQRDWSGFWDTGIIEESHVLAHDRNGVISNPFKAC